MILYGVYEQVNDKGDRKYSVSSAPALEGMEADEDGGSAEPPKEAVEKPGENPKKKGEKRLLKLFKARAAAGAYKKKLES